ncbi:MAG: hypothetical protein KBS96_00650 [Lachnospiraceae bacterium]|nr:hypothetical protein [Candidatus Colinaster scatohippi]
MSGIDAGRERLDLKRLWNQFVHKLWIVIAAAIAGAIIGVMAYSIYGKVIGPDVMYEIRNDYYVFFNYDASFNGADYFNAYTWDSILRDDPIVNSALEILPGVSKEQIYETITGEIIGDYRILTVVSKGSDADLVYKVSEAYKQALPMFADRIPILEKIEVWTDSDMVSYDPYTREKNAAFLGGMIGIILALSLIMIMCAIDDGIYTERDWLQRYPEIPFLGKKGTDEYSVNTEHILGDESEYILFDSSEFSFSMEVFEKLRAGKGVILLICRGRDKADKIDKIVFTLGKQDVKIVGMAFSDK